MPMIQCDFRRGRTKEQRDRLIRDLTQVIHEVSGAPVDTIAAVVRELPGPSTYEGGEPSPEYRPGPDGFDLAAVEELEARRKKTDNDQGN